MAFIKEKIAEKKIPKKVVPQQEDRYDRIKREGREQRAQEIEDKKQKELDRITEEKRLEKITIPYVENLKEQLLEKNLIYFWTFPDRSGFTKYQDLSVGGMQKFLYSNVDKYKNRLVASFRIIFCKDNGSGLFDQSKKKMRIIINIGVFEIDKNGKLGGKDNFWGLDFHWTDKDFKTTKFSFKLMHRLLIPVSEELLTGISLFSTGLPITQILEQAKKLKLNLNDALTPLAGA